MTDTTNSLYSNLFNYVNGHRQLTFGEYESAILKDICLFNVPSDEYLYGIESTLDSIIRALPAFKRIFSRPIIRLKDEHHIVPIEAVKTIDNRSLTSLAAQCNLWDNITNDGIKPRKLMTAEHVETYSIYENIVFVHTVDQIFEYISRAIVRIKDIIYGCRDIHFNLLDKTYHRSYFLAMGKLYLEYVSSNDSKDSCSRCIEKMSFIEKTLRQRLSSPVYKSCKRKDNSLNLKKTNIFRSHKDYAEVYKILKELEAKRGVDAAVKSDKSVKDAEYKAFCKVISLFALSHFNYELPKDLVIDLHTPDWDCEYFDWKLSVRWVEHSVSDAMIFTTKKNKIFSTCVMFADQEEVSSKQLKVFKQDVNADEYLFCDPNTHSGDNLYLSIYDIDSFRRIQQILLRGMILSDSEHMRCAFCGKEASKTERSFLCKHCLSEIIPKICPTTDKEYLVSDIAQNTTAHQNSQSFTPERKFLHDRLSEAQLHFRNITPITKFAKPICPHCNKAHN